MRRESALDGRVNLLALSWCINIFALSITYPFLPIYLHSQRGYALGLVGLIYPVMGLGRVLAPLLSGHLIDGIGRRRVLILSPLARGATYGGLVVLALFEAPLWAIAAVLFLGAVIGEFFSTSADAYLTDITRARQRAEAFSRIRIGINVGWVLGPMIGAYLAFTPFALLFGITAVVCCVPAVLARRWCPETATAAAGPPPPLRQFVQTLRADRAFLFLLLLILLLYLTQSQLASTLSVYAKETVGITRIELGLLYTLNGLLVILLTLPCNWCLARVNAALRLALGAALLAAGYFAIGLCDRWAGLLGAVSVFTLGEILANPVLGATASRLAPAGMIGRYMGAYRLAFALGMSLGPWFGAVLYEHWQGAGVALWGSLALGAIMAFFGFLALIRHPVMQPEAAETPES